MVLVGYYVCSGTKEKRYNNITYVRQGLWLLLKKAEAVPPQAEQQRLR
jgi:hypothetical protein